MKLYFKKAKIHQTLIFFGIHLECRGKVCYLILHLEDWDSLLRKSVCITTFWASLSGESLATFIVIGGEKLLK